MNQDQDHQPQAQAANYAPQFVRSPQVYESGADLDLYLRRFEAYGNAIQCPAAQRKDLLLSLLCDRTLAGVELDIVENPDMTFAELCVLLRRNEGYLGLREKFVTELRSRRKTKGETIRDFYVDLAKLAAKAYEDPAVRRVMLKETFVANLEDPQVQMRLREHAADYDANQIVELAILLESCKEPYVKTFTINTTNTGGPNPAFEQRQAKMAQRLDDITKWMEKLALSMHYQQSGPEAGTSGTGYEDGPAEYAPDNDTPWATSDFNDDMGQQFTHAPCTYGQ